MHNIATSAAVDGGIIIKLVVVGRLLFTFFFLLPVLSSLWRDMYSAWTKKYKLTYLTNNNEL